MTSIDELGGGGGTTLKHDDLDGAEVTLTIAGYAVKEFDEKDMETGETYKKKKPILSFEETEKTLVCNVTNQRAIANGHGSREMDDWIGKEIILFPATTPFGNKEVPCIRVRVAVKPGAKPKFLKNGPKDEHPFAPGNDDAF
jgi:hypothetical protein